MTENEAIMVFSDDYRYYCRSEIALTMHGGKKAADSFKKLYGMELKEGKTSYYIAERLSVVYDLAIKGSRR